MRNESKGGRRPLLKEKATAECLGIEEATLRRWRWEGKGPRFAKIGGTVSSSADYSFDRVEIYALATSGEGVIVAADDLLGELPRSHSPDVLQAQFRPANSSTSIGGWRAKYPFRNYFGQA